ncbi:hypothetical protein BN12_380011 [Nostocoides japonicum T1-X7]|uniref:Uncharacterized protein n=1 Tax=Nostocoides japonicum T1-X7 TaxID=1194083 RepID=A0A077M447_9MICO|nr:hypothetical protein BN12_380011 [Tetrasphaera japonica T1-X7]
MAGTATHRVFVGANMFYSRTLRDWLGLRYPQGDEAPTAVYSR